MAQTLKERLSIPASASAPSGLSSSEAVSVVSRGAFIPVLCWLTNCSCIPGSWLLSSLTSSCCVSSRYSSSFPFLPVPYKAPPFFKKYNETGLMSFPGAQGALLLHRTKSAPAMHRQVLAEERMRSEKRTFMHQGEKQPAGALQRRFLQPWSERNRATAPHHRDTHYGC